MKEIIVLARTEELAHVLCFIEKNLNIYAVSRKTRMQIALAAEEIFVNIANYAYQDREGVAVIQCGVSEDQSEVTICFLDDGKPYNPLVKSDPDITAGLEERQMGGLGILLVKKSMDIAEYRCKDGKNMLTIKKYINKNNAEEKTKWKIAD